MNMITSVAAAAAAAHGPSAASESTEMLLINAHSKLKPDLPVVGLWDNPCTGLGA